MSDTAKAAHTAGKWMISSATLVCGSDAKIIANCSFGIAEGISPPFEEAMANARLIAAAPDLLAACEAALSYLGEYDEPRHPRAALSIKCRAAISKATGTL